LETWRGAMTACPGMGKGRLRGRTEIENKLVQRSSEPVITRVV
jgi:hypothetical protein